MKRIDIVNELCAAIEQDHRSLFNIGQAAGVSDRTIYGWLVGKISNPKVDTLDAVARVLGKQVAFIDGQWTVKPLVAKRPRMALWRLQ